MKRSLSSGSGGEKSPRSRPINKVEGNIEVKRLTHEESLSAAFYITVWISEHPSFNDLDKTNMMGLSMDLMLQVMKMSKLAGMRDLLRDPNSLLKLFMCTMRLENSSLQVRFSQLLENFLNAKPTNAEDAGEQAIVEDIKALLVYHLENILKFMIKYSASADNKSAFAHILKGDISASTWLEYVSFVLERLLVAAESLNDAKVGGKGDHKKGADRKKAVKKEEGTVEAADSAVLAKPGMNRSMSLSKEERAREINIESVDKSGNIPLEIVTALISLLFPEQNSRAGYNFSQSTKGWSLVMKTVLKVEIGTLIKAKIFENLVSSFLVAGEDIQQIMYTEIVKLTQNMISNQSHQKELCQSVLTVAFSTLSSIPQDKYEPVIFALVKGWLDILLTKESPKPEAYLNKPAEKAYCKLNLSGTLTLMNHMSNYLWTQNNYGSKDGVLNSNELQILKLQIADDLLNLLITSESAFNLLAVSEVFANYKNHQD
jgi:hypothetical protein